MGLGQTAVAGMEEVAAAGGLGDGAVDPAALGVAVPPGVGGLFGAKLALGLVLEAGLEGEMTGQDRRAGAAGSIRAGGCSPAGGRLPG